MVFVAPLMTFHRYRPSLQGFPLAAAPGSNSLKLGVTALVVLASLSERLGMAETTLVASSLVGFVRSCPAADITVARPLQTAFRINCACTPPIPSRMPSSAAHYHAYCKFRPRGFSPPRRVAPRDGFGCFAIRASQSSLRCRFHRPPTPWQAKVRRYERRTFPAARAPFEEPLSSTGDNTSRCSRYPHEVASHLVQTRRPFPNAWPSAGHYSVDDCGPPRSPLPVHAMVRVLPWASIS
jgi:hypothetical protein